METKQQIRKRRLICREEMDETAVRQISAQIGNRLWEYFDRGRTVRKVGVYGYYPHRKEVDLTILYQNLLQANVPLAFPRVSGETMEFFRVRSMEEDFEEGAFHIMEPRRSCSRADFYDAVCLIPGSVFDRKGNRYGYGRGYYDRYLSLHPKLYRMGIAYEEQTEDEILPERCDVSMHALATEKGILFFGT
ncbi:5-formyltetrahydrofolate cyclo-ligase [Lachnospiraceae bacterium]|nr:5-formyltetrahydrofolate cyclo-ligase [Lachnospiraceae bacterium]